MPVARLADYWENVLPESHREALHQAVSMLVDDFLGTTEHKDSLLISFLPPRYVPRYNELFSKMFFAVFMSVAYQLAQASPPVPTLSCIAEELACHALISEAEVLLKEQGVDPEFGIFEDEIFQDADYEYLFSGELDGIEDSDMGDRLGIGHLHFDEWFEPFLNAQTEVHPYCQD